MQAQSGDTATNPDLEVTAEKVRLAESDNRRSHWKRWGPYLSERAWGTVREDYSPYGTAWEYLSHDQSRSRAYRWNEDGIAGICDRRQKICFSVALWNGRDAIIKERLFGLTGNEGNHGEDVKENYYYLDSTPTHSYMKCLYKYPQAAFPYGQLVRENAARGRDRGEYELEDTGVFNESRYFDVFTEYAKATTEEILIRITVANRGPEARPIHVMPTIWFRNTWSWGHDVKRPWMRRLTGTPNVIELNEPLYGKRWIVFEGLPQLLFTENETNEGSVAGGAPDPMKKDAINDFVVKGFSEAVNPAQIGTKASAHYHVDVPAGGEIVIRARLVDAIPTSKFDLDDFEAIFARRIREADHFYETVIPAKLSADARNVMRQSLAGMMWSKQFYHYVVRDWLHGDPSGPKPHEQRLHGRNKDWLHLYNADVISMPDKWEYPWYAAWDLAFHCIPIALIDPEFAKEQLSLMVREWYMHPNGQLPAYEWAFGDVNPPVHGWAAWRVYKIDKKNHGGRGDRVFLQRIFHKLMLNFTWWVNRKDSEGRNVFQGGFLGLDNIGVFDRSAPLPTGGCIQQADGTGWMAMYSLNLLAIAMELARDDPSYEDVASKFWEHFLHIANAINNLGNDGTGMWNDQDGFFYDVLSLPGRPLQPMRIRSMVGLIPLFAVETLEADIVDELDGFKRRMEWFIENRPDLTKNVASMRARGMGQRRLLSIVGEDQLRRVLQFMLDENEFLSPYGIRALSRAHADNPYRLRVDGTEYTVKYEPAESSTGIFGGNSNWRGPIWFPVNFLLIESLQKFHHYLGPDFQVECPTGSGKYMNLWDVSVEISRRLTRTFLKSEDGSRPVHRGIEQYRSDPHWNDLILFYEFFHGDNGSGLGAPHQTGWTGIVAKLLQQSGE
jgi:hypothetical protein